MENLNSESNEEDYRGRYLGDNLLMTPESYRVNKESWESRIAGVYAAIE